MADTATIALNGTLKTAGGTTLANQPVTFTDSLGTSIPGVNTDPSGNFLAAKYNIPAPQANYTATVSFAGVAGAYNPSTATSTPQSIAVDTSVTITVTVS